MQQQAGALQVQVGVFRRQRNGLVDRGQRAFAVPAQAQGSGEQALRLRILRLRRHGIARGGQGLGRSAAA